MDKRKLVTIRTISDIQPIEGADKIVVASVDGWKVVVQKDEYKLGEKVFYFEIDSMLPISDPAFSFLAPRGTKIVDNIEYHRLKTAKLRGQISQGLLLPYKMIEESPWKERWNENPHTEDEDFSGFWNVIKYEPPMPANLRGKMKPWPAWIEKTDEERIQNLPKLKIDPKDWYATEKIDGTSCTIFTREKETGEIENGLCSRNYEIIEEDGNTYWDVVKATKVTFQYNEISLYEYLQKMREFHGYKSLVFQGEIFGESIQSNPLGMKGQTIRIFNVIADGERLVRVGMEKLFPELTNLWVPIIPASIPTKMEDIIKQPDGVVTWIAGAKLNQIEGFVWRNKETSTMEYDGKIVPASFKAISSKYLLKHEG